MKKFKKLTTLLIAVIMLMQVILPTASYAVDTIKLNIQHERPYSDDDGDGTIGNDVYTLYRTAPHAPQTVFKIGELKDDETLDFNNSYYCLRGGLGFGSTEEILADGVEYTVYANLSDKNKVKEYYANVIGHEISDEAYNAICWIADNMYLPKSVYKSTLKDNLLNNAGITNSELTDDDIEVVQQLALWYFSNLDENGEENSLSLSDEIDVANLLRINGNNANNDTSVAYNKVRESQINTLYRYIIDTAKVKATTYPEPIVNPTMELDKTLSPNIAKTTVEGSSAIIVGPFKISGTYVDTYRHLFNAELKYKEVESQQEWDRLTIDNETSTVCITDSNGASIDRVNKIEDMINNGNFYITIFNDELNISNIENFELDIYYQYSYLKATNANILIAGNDDQIVLSNDITKYIGSKTDKVTIEKINTFDLALRKYIVSTDGTELTGELNRTPKIEIAGLRDGTATTATYTHPKNPIYLKRGNNIVYAIRVYNEGQIDGYAKEITDYLCDDLEYVNDSAINEEYGWVLGEDGKTVKTTYTGDKLLKAYDSSMTAEQAQRNGSKWQEAEDGTDGLYYTEVLIECKIKNTATVGITLPNVAEITADLANGTEDINDRDSEPDSLQDDDIRNYETRPWLQDDDDYERVIVEPDSVFDLALRKYITKINGINVENTREPNINVDALDAKTSKTAEYKHRKDPVEIKTGDFVMYNLTIYNEGEVAGRATKIADQLPTGLEFYTIVSGNYELLSYDRTTNKVIFTEKTENSNLEPKSEGRMPDSTTLTIVCKVTARAEETDKILTNVAWIAEDYNADSEEITDRDSKPSTTPNVNKDNMSNYNGKNNKTDLADSNYYYKGQQDDDDFEKLVLKGKAFDLSLRKYISNIDRNGKEVEFESRVPSINTETLKNGTFNRNGILEHTATYIHPKNALTVKQGDIITYKLRVYNEGDVDGYATEITDYIPEGLGFLYGFSGNSNWLISTENVESKLLVGENGLYKTESEVPNTGIFAGQNINDITIVTAKKQEGQTNNCLEIKDYTSIKDSIIKRYGAEVNENDKWQQSTNSETDGLFYEEIEVTCIVLAPNTWQEKIVNVAEISQDKAVDTDGTELNIDDRDSRPDSLTDEELKDYEENPWYQDDDDYEPVELRYFDLALRKFITGVNDTEVTTRIPEFYIDEEGNYKYRHDKTPVEVVNKDNVTYTIRVFNEGTIAGYVEEIEDDIPEGLIFLPEDETNKKYGWKMYYYDEDMNLVETDDVELGAVIRTTYLSEENGTEDPETGKNNNLLESFNKNTMTAPDSRDVKVVFKVSQKDIPEDNEDGIIINKAQITEDSDDDEDSTPDEWIDEEDDQDIEKIYVQEFDLALFKWVTKTIVTVDGKTTTTETGFKPNVGKTEQSGENYRDNNEAEPIAAVTIDKKKLKSTVVKFEYNIKVVNEGDLAGYATEITDYIPNGLKFVAEDNPLWTEGENGTIKTRALETVLLEPGKSATIPVTFTWINNSENLGLKTNIAAITEDYNDKAVEDIDSIPGNEDIPNYDKEQEDDDDFALVILTLKTGMQVTYLGLTMAVIAIIAVGVMLIKKYVL